MRLIRRLLRIGFAALLVAVPVSAAQEASDYARAVVLVQRGQWDSGIAGLNQILAADPGNLKARNLLGIALTGKGDLAGANREFRQILKTTPAFYPALKNLAVNELTLKDVKAAERHFSAASKLAPDDPVIHAYLGEIAYSRQDYKNAAIHLARAGPVLQQTNPAAHLARSYLETGREQDALDILHKLDKASLGARGQFSIGLALAQHELYGEAVPFFELVRQVFPDSYDAGFDLANCYVEAKQYPQAIETLLALKERGHKTAELDNLLGEAYEGNQQVNEAINSLREATQIAPEDEDNYIDLATLCIDHDSYDLGLEILNVGLHYRPQSDRLVFQRGILHAMQSQFELADQDFELASKLAPEKNLSYIGLSVSYMHTGNLPEAVATLRQRVKAKPDDSLLQFLLGETLIRSGASPGAPDFTEAKVAFEHSIKLNPKFAPSFVQLGKLNLREGHVDEAVAMLEKARSLDPTDKAAYSQLAIAYRRQGKAAMATGMLSELAKLNDEERAKNSHGRQRIVREDSATKDPSP